MRTGRPEPFRKRAARSTSNTREVSGWYFSIRQIFAVVPPMSKDSTLLSPSRAAICAAKIAPPAGPDSTSRTGKRRAVSIEVTPPPEVTR